MVAYKTASQNASVGVIFMIPLSAAIGCAGFDFPIKRSLPNRISEKIVLNVLIENGDPFPTENLHDQRRVEACPTNVGLPDLVFHRLFSQVCPARLELAIYGLKVRCINLLCYEHSTKMPACILRWQFPHTQTHLASSFLILSTPVISPCEVFAKLNFFMWGST